MIGRRSLFPAVVAGVVVLLAACGGGGETSPSPAPSSTAFESTVASPSAEPTAASTLKPDEQENVEAARTTLESYFEALDHLGRSGGADPDLEAARALVVPNSSADQELQNLATSYKEFDIRVQGSTVLERAEASSIDLSAAVMQFDICFRAEGTFTEGGSKPKPAEIPAAAGWTKLRFLEGRWLVEDFSTQEVAQC